MTVGTTGWLLVNIGYFRLRNFVAALLCPLSCSATNLTCWQGKVTSQIAQFVASAYLIPVAIIIFQYSSAKMGSLWIDPGASFFFWNQLSRGGGGGVGGGGGDSFGGRPQGPNHGDALPADAPVACAAGPHRSPQMTPPPLPISWNYSGR